MLKGVWTVAAAEWLWITGFGTSATCMLSMRLYPCVVPCFAGLWLASRGAGQSELAGI